MFFTLFILSAVLISLSLAALAIKMLIKKGGKFPETHIGRNKAMRERGIVCAQNLDVGCHPTDNLPGCATCKVPNS
jgi:hypothetical protein